MALKTYMIGSHGPYYYDDEEVVNEPDSPFDGEVRHALMCEQVHITTAPTADTQVLRKGDLASGISGLVPYTGATSNVDLNSKDLTGVDDLAAARSKFGGATHYSEFETDGTLVAHGDATTWDDVPPSSVTVATTGPNFPSHTSYNGNLKAYEFVGSGVTLKEMNFGFQFRHSQKTSGTITLGPHIHLYIPNDVTGGVIKFYLEFTWAGVDEAGTINTTTISGTVTRAANAGINNNAILAFGNITGTGKGISSILMTRLYRDPADAADTFGSSVWLKSADVHIECDTLGSRSEYSK